MFLRALLAFLALPGIVAFAVPLLVFAPRTSWRGFSLIGGVIVGAGTLVLAWCVRDFYVLGHGTLAPWDPPRALVRRGLYRYSRNPMYLGVLCIVSGWAIGFHSPGLAVYAFALAVLFHLRVVLGEEPFLARTHGVEWEQYSARVHRWLGWTSSPHGGKGASVPGIEVGPSRIEGLGIFALRSFAPGNRITRVHVVREITPAAPIREDQGERLDHCAYPDGKTLLIAFPERHVNHSCDPNAYESFEAGSSFLVARRAIAAGEEITIDYNINVCNGTAWTCRCGALRCRGEVAGDFFRLPIEWQREYRPLVADWFVRRNSARFTELDRDIGAAER